MSERIVQLGLNQCPICGGVESLRVLRVPAVLQIGGTEGTCRRDPADQDVNILFMVVVECAMCGYTMLFNSLRLFPNSSPSLVPGSMSEADEDEAEPT